MTDFHEVRFPLDVSLHGRGGPERRTEILTLGSNRESRNARWDQSRRRYEAGYGVKNLTQLAKVLDFFEERRGRLYGFRWRDRIDHASCLPGNIPTPFDQNIGSGDGVRRSFPLIKTYGGSFAPYVRRITKPVEESVRIAVDGDEHTTQITLDPITGVVTFSANSTPPPGATISAGFLFDTAVRFDVDYLEIDLEAFEAGAIPKIPIIELLL